MESIINYPISELVIMFWQSEAKIPGTYCCIYHLKCHCERYSMFVAVVVALEASTSVILSIHAINMHAVLFRHVSI